MLTLPDVVLGARRNAKTARLGLAATIIALAFLSTGAVTQAMAASSFVNVRGHMKIVDNDGGWDADDTWEGDVVPGFAGIVTANGFQTSLFSNFEACADEVVVEVEDAGVAARDDRRLEVHGSLNLYEYTNCSNAKEDLDGHKSFRFTVDPGAVEEKYTYNVHNTNEGGDDAQLDVYVTNYPLPY